MQEKFEQTLKPGDIVGFLGNHWQSQAINILSCGIPFWGLSHIGIVAEHKGQPYIFESTIDDNVLCDIMGSPISGVQAHEVTKRVLSYDGKVWRYPLYRNLYRYECDRLTGFLVGELGKSYDVTGMFSAGGFVWSHVWRMFTRQDFSEFWCSELVAAAIQQTGLLPISHASWYSPNRLTYKLRRKGLLQRPERLK